MRDEQEITSPPNVDAEQGGTIPNDVPSSKLTEALSYYNLGLTPIRGNYPIEGENGIVGCSCGLKDCKTPGKHPFGSWKDYQKIRPSEKLIHLWFIRNAPYNLGLVHGHSVGTTLLDWDGIIGLNTRQALESEYGPLPPCPVVITPGGGEHQLFRHPGMPVPTRRGLRAGFDVRADGGFSIAPPSTHKNGGSYRWKDDCHPSQIPLPDLPPAWVEIVTAQAIAATTSAMSSTSMLPSGVHYDIPDDGDDPKIVDGREEYARNTVAAVLRDLCRSLGRIPTADEIFDTGWPQYERKVDLTKPGRGADEFLAKCQYAFDRAHQGAFPDLEFKPLKPDQTKRQVNEPSAADLPIMTTTEAYDLPPPKWLIPNLLIRDTIALLYGPPGSLKSFFAVDIALSVAHGVSWAGKAVERTGVAYIAAEGATGLGIRCAAWEHHHGVAGRDNLFRLIPTTVNLRESAQVDRLILRLHDVGTLGGFQFGLVIFDTVARSMVGGDENSALEVGVVMEAATLIRRALGSAVLMVHHTGKDRNRGMRGSNRFLADADTTLEVERNEEGRQFTVSVRKQKDAEDGQAFCLVAQKVDLPLRPGRGVEGSLVVVPDPNDPATQKETKHDADRHAIGAMMEAGQILTVSKVATLVADAFGMGRGVGLYERITDAFPMGDVFTVVTSAGHLRLSRTAGKKGKFGEISCEACSDEDGEGV